MMIRGKGKPALILTLILAWGLQAAAQESQSDATQPSTSAQAASRAAAQTQSSVSAELVKGRLNPAKSKPGDEVAVRLNEDLKSNGEVVLKKGSTVRGVVKKVQRIDSKASARGSGSAQSMMELQWFAPRLSGAASQQLNVALQSVVYTNPLYTQQQEANDSFLNAPRSAAPARRG